MVLGLGRDSTALSAGLPLRAAPFGGRDAWASCCGAAALGAAFGARGARRGPLCLLAGLVPPAGVSFLFSVDTNNILRFGSGVSAGRGRSFS